MMTPTANKTKNTKHTRKEKGRSGVTILLKHLIVNICISSCFDNVELGLLYEILIYCTFEIQTRTDPVPTVISPYRENNNITQKAR